MPSHDVEMSIPTTKVVLHADVVFEIRSDDEKLGELRVSKGSIDWYPAKAKIPVKLARTGQVTDLWSGQDYGRKASVDVVLKGHEGTVLVVR